MKIDNSLKSLGTLAGENRPAKGGKSDSTSAAAGTPESGVSVELSGVSAQIHSQLSSGEVIDSARVAEIKRAIAEGRFQVNPDVVADRLLKTVQELISAYRH
jgi:negative regulator of flagellin synthesis FlgM